MPSAAITRSLPLCLALLACGGGSSSDDSATNEGAGGQKSAGGAAGQAGNATGGKAGASNAGQAGAAASAGQAGATSAGQAGASSAGQAGASSAGQAGASSAGQAGASSAGQAGATSAGQAGATSAGQAGATSAGQAGATSAGQAGASSAGQAGAAGSAPQVPVRKIPGLESITFYETTGATQSYKFLVNGPELSKKLPDPLGAGNQDITGTSIEFYDVYYSDKDGGFDVDGAYLTISGVFPAALPAGGGLNLAEISLDYAAGSQEFGNYVASFVALGDNAVPADVSRCIDGDLGTWTTMGNTVGTASRLRLTLGFLSSSGKP